MSGTDNFDRSQPHAPFVREMLRLLEIPEGEVSLLEKVPYPLLVKAYQAAARKVGATLNWGPLPNGYYLGHPVEVGFSPFAKTVPLMVGTVVAEFGGFQKFAVSPTATEEEKREAIRQTYTGHDQEIIPLFQQAYPHTDLSAVPKWDTWVRPGRWPF